MCRWYKSTAGAQWGLSQKAVWYMLNDVLIWKQFPLVQESASRNQPLQLALTDPTVSFFSVVSGKNINIKMNCILSYVGALIMGHPQGVSFLNRQNWEAIFLSLWRNPKHNQDLCLHLPWKLRGLEKKTFMDVVVV